MALSINPIHVERARAYAPFTAFVGGFVFDILTLRGPLNWLNLGALGAYALLVSVLLILQARGAFEKWAKWLSYATQFGLGALFSAMVVLYFKSSHQLFSFLFVMILFCGMVANEFLHKDKRLREIIWGIYAVSLAMLLNFVIPYALDSVRPVYFYLSTAMALGLVVVVWLLAGRIKQLLRGPLISVGILVGVYAIGLIPPVPLVMKNGLVCTDFIKAEYSCAPDAQGFSQKLGAAPVVTKDSGDAVYVLTAVAAPKGAHAVLEHRWFQEVEGSWQARDVMTFEIKGGRKDGWRFWSRKRYARPGYWKVETALKGGNVLGVQKIKVEEPRDEAKKSRQLL